MAHYVDFHTGELLDTLTVPLTHRVVKVPAVPHSARARRGSRSRSTSGRSSIRRRSRRNGVRELELLGEVHLLRSLGAACGSHRRGNSACATRTDASIRIEGAEHLPIYYREWTIWRGPAEVALDPTKAYCPAELSYTAMTSWRPWMQMGDLKGHTLDSGRGGKARRWSDLPTALPGTHAGAGIRMCCDDPERALRLAAEMSRLGIRRWLAVALCMATVLASGCTALVTGAHAGSSMQPFPASAVSRAPARDCADCPELVSIPAGEFTMGAQIEEPRRLGLPEYWATREQPRHRVRIAHALRHRRAMK